jgi:hypothetical protein
MGVSNQMQWLAYEYRGEGKTLRHYDLVREPNGDGQTWRYLIYDAQWDFVRETLDEATARQRLAVWVHEEPDPTKGKPPRSQVTDLGRKFLVTSP